MQSFFSRNCMGLAGLNIDACRIGDDVRVNPPAGNKSGGNSYNMSVVGMPANAEPTVATGRFPANLLLNDEMLGEQSRFFYCAKASKKDRGEGNDHATVKPQALMTYLLRLLSTPTGGVILDPFAGSGTTALAAKKLGLACICVEKDPHNCDIIVSRLEHD